MEKESKVNLNLIEILLLPTSIGASKYPELYESYIHIISYLS